MNRQQQRAVLDAFLADNHELHQLTGKLSTFNLFDVLRAANNELRHSNVLAWLMTPTESHGFGDRFLRRFLSRCLLQNQEHSLVNVQMSAADVELADFGRVQILRERHHIDIMVVVPAPHRWVFIIENKVHSGETSGQLRRYAAAAAEEFPNSSRVGIFLTLDGQEASADGKELGYIPFSHESVGDLLNEMLALHSDLSPSVRMLLTHYLLTIRRLTMSDPEIVELCQTIYKRHRKALDLIMEYGVSSQFSGIVVDVLESEWSKKHLPMGQLSAKTNTVWFIPEGWQAPLNQVGGPGWPGFPVGVACGFYQKTQGERTLLFVEVGPIDNHAKRCAILDGLKGNGFRVPDKAYTVESKYTRVYSDHRKRKEGDDDAAVVLQMLKKAAPRFRKITEVLESI